MARSRTRRIGARQLGVVGQVGAQALGQGEHPLADGHGRQHGVVQVGGHLDHTTGAARGAGAAALAREGHEPLGGAAVAAHAGKAVGQDAAAQVGAEVIFDPVGHTAAVVVL